MFSESLIEVYYNIITSKFRVPKLRRLIWIDINDRFFSLQCLIIDFVHYLLQIVSEIKLKEKC